LKKNGGGVSLFLEYVVYGNVNDFTPEKLDIIADSIREYQTP